MESHSNTADRPGGQAPSDGAASGSEESEAARSGRFGRYEIEDEPFGSGAMAEVYRAYDADINRNVAIKILHGDLCVNDEIVSRFVTEAKAAGGLSHANIVTVFDVGKTENRPYIVMELVEGDPLNDVLRGGKQYTEIEIVKLGRQVADALDYAHKAGIVHRDIKPANMLIDRGTGRVKITDFGIAHMADASAKHKTMAGNMLGTPQYMSPEQVTGDQVDGRSDLFSTGVVLYQLLAGQSPFDGDTIGEIMVKIKTEAIPPLKKVAPQASPGLVKIIEKLLEKEPAKRFQTGAALRDALDAELGSMLEAEENKGKGRTLPLRFTWPAIMAVAMAVLMGASAKAVFTAQSNVFSDLAGDTGAAVAELVAYQSVEDVILEQYSELDIMVREISAKPSYAYVHITDKDGIIRASSSEALVGQVFTRDPAAETIGEYDGVWAGAIPGGPNIDFEAPLEFNNTAQGFAYLGITRSALTEALADARRQYIWIAGLTILAVGLMGFVAFTALSRPIRTAANAMRAVRDGNTSYRISQTRRDEFGRLFEAFNGMVDAMGRPSGQAPGGRRGSDAAPLPSGPLPPRPVDGAAPVPPLGAPNRPNDQAADSGTTQGPGDSADPATMPAPEEPAQGPQDGAAVPQGPLDFPPGFNPDDPADDRTRIVTYPPGPAAAPGAPAEPDETAKSKNPSDTDEAQK